MAYRALIPVKSLAEAKSRLATHMTQEQRSRLVLTMLHHVLCILQGSGLLEQISVVSPDERVLASVRAWGAQPLVEEQHGHNPALHAAAARELATGATALLTISADLPLLRSQDIRSMLEASQRHDVVLAASQDGTGTNAILVRPPLALPYVFGTHSLQRYLEEAKQRHLSATLYKSSGTAFDIDTIEDVTTLRNYKERDELAHSSSTIHHFQYCA
jgi:2-phospho-L-lactate/phosphoenolpyruvate guanylyltransferase